MNMSNIGKSDTVKMLAEMQAVMEHFHQELIVIKSGSISMGTNLLLGVPRGVQHSGSSGLYLDKAGKTNAVERPTKTIMTWDRMMTEQRMMITSQ